MKKILVTGASGYIGRHVVEQLVKDNVEVIAVDINLDNLPNTHLKSIYLFLHTSADNTPNSDTQAHLPSAR